MSLESIELTITRVLTCIDNLFDYKSDKERQREQFAGQIVLLPLPRNNSHYYFFHKHKYNRKGKIQIEHRRAPISNLEEGTHKYSQLLNDYKLLGGIHLYKNSKGKIIMNILKSTDIQQKIRSDVQLQKEQEESTYKPKLNIRSFPEGYPIQPGQELKVGKVELMITNIDYDPENCQQNQKQDVLYLRHSKAQTLFEKDTGEEQTVTHGPEEQEEVSSQGPTCRICMHPETADNILIAPCMCKGSAKYIHASCLKDWLTQKNTNVRDSLENFEFGHHKGLICEVCLNRYPKVVVFPSGQKYPLLNVKGQTLVSFQYLQNQSFSNLINRYMISLGPGKPITIGRFENHSIVLGEQSVSRNHCVIDMNPSGRIVVKDTDSKFGTLLFDSQATIQLSHRIMRSFQIENVGFGVKILREDRY